MNPEVAIKCVGLHKSYGDVHAVRGLDLEVRAGECFGLLGPNGAGKTTTLEILEGLLDPSAGEVEILGQTWTGNVRALRERLGVQLQETKLPEKLRVMEVLRLFRSFYKKGRTPEEVLETVELTEKKKSLLAKLSGGQRQRLAIGCAIVSDPDLLFLDEPTTGLDPQARWRVWELVERFKERGKTVLLTTHYMEEAERLADRVAIVDHGRVIKLGTPLDLVRELGEEVVEFKLEEGSPSPDEETLRNLPGVNAIKYGANGVAMLTVIKVHQAVPALLSTLQQSGAKLSMLTTHRATLEDVFVSLTGRSLRDA